ncbi:MAG TPA: SAM-dependent methyltransferase [Actinomycetota bacterium]|nr:SAM-dependent methyltransferase [Actinomycetota bacterium]
MTTSESETPLAERLRRRIASNGPITFAEFVEAALYDPKDGFYSRAAIGEDAHFVTSPHISAAFGSLVAQQIEEFWELLDRPATFTIVEGGAGTGVLARQILEALGEPLRQATRYVAVERSAAVRDEMRAARIEVAATLAEVGGGAVGCVMANELLDNLPFHRVKAAEHGIVELFVSVDGERFILEEGSPSSEDVSRQAPSLRVGEEGVVNLEALRFLDQAAGLLDRGYIWLVDYGWPSVEHGALVHGYRDHRVEEDVLSNPGSRDITAGVDFDALVRHGRSRGLNVWGPVTQREALMALGYEEWERTALAGQGQSLSERRGIDAIRTFSERGRARMLVDPSGPGGFYVVCFGVGTDRPPRSVRGTSYQSSGGC